MEPGKRIAVLAKIGQFGENFPQTGKPPKGVPAIFRLRHRRMAGFQHLSGRRGSVFVASAGDLAVAFREKAGLAYRSRSNGA